MFLQRHRTASRPGSQSEVVVDADPLDRTLHIDVRVLEQPKPELEFENPSDALVEACLGDVPGVD